MKCFLSVNYGGRWGWLIGALVLSAIPASAATFTVNSTADTSDATVGNGVCATLGNVCTLRAAIEEANVTTGHDTIEFDITSAAPRPARPSIQPARLETQTSRFWFLDWFFPPTPAKIQPVAVRNAAAHTISPSSSLPNVTDLVTIDGYSQPGASANTLAAGSNAVLQIVLDGSSLPGGATAVLTVNGSGSTIRGLVIDNGPNNRLELRGVGGHKVEGCFVGTDAAGSAVSGSTRANNSGISVYSDNNLIGGSTLAARNLISGMSDEGLYIGSANNTVQNNLIGTNASGTAAIANSIGVRVGGFEFSGAGTNPNGTQILGNVISGNTGNGVQVYPDSGGLSATNTTIQGNIIGLNAQGTAALANGERGISVESASSPFPENNAGPVTGVQIGGTQAGQGNIISGNSQSGISTGETKVSGVVIEGNTIGLNAVGTAAVGNRNGITAQANGTVIGGSSVSARNVISGNTIRGIEFGGTLNLSIQNNFIGTNRAGTAALGNGEGGIRGGAGNRNALNLSIENNVVSGNGEAGIHLQDSGNPTIEVPAPFLRIRGNFIGTNFSGTAAIPNVADGIIVNNSRNATIGGTTAAHRNIISGNSGSGILLYQNSPNNQISGNFIGLSSDGQTALGNGGEGIFLLMEDDAARNTRIGGTVDGSGNTIAHNVGNGILVYGSVGNSFLGNSIFSNGLLGIDLRTGIGSGSGQVTPNDVGDADFGDYRCNNLQNFPLVTGVSSGVASGTLNSAPNATFRIEIFANAAADASGNGEGKDFVGAANCTTGADGNGIWSFAIESSIVGRVLSATATDASGNTSEFGPTFTIPVVPSLSINDASVLEGSEGRIPLVFTVSISPAPTTNVTVNYSVEGVTATSGTDFVPVAPAGLQFTPTGPLTQTLTVQIKGDTTDEPDETLRVVLSAPQNAALNRLQGVGTIQDDDQPPKIFVDDASIVEGDSGQKLMIFPVRLSKASLVNVSMQLQTTNGTATAGSDYGPLASFFTIPAGQIAKNFEVAIKGDVVDEANESFNLNAHSYSNARAGDMIATGTIFDNDDNLKVTIAPISRAEGNSGTQIFQFAIQLDGPETQTHTLNVETLDGTATVVGSDYVAFSAPKIFAPGETTKNFSVTVNGDTRSEANETFQVRVSEVVKGATVQHVLGVGTIQNDDAQPILRLESDTATVLEGDFGEEKVVTLFVSRIGDAQGSEFVGFKTQSETALGDQDYVTKSGILEFTANETRKPISFRVKGDNVREGDETFRVDLHTPQNAVLGRASTTITIEDNESRPVISIKDASANETDSGDTVISFQVRLSLPTTKNVSVDVTTSSGTALSGADFTANTRRLTIPANSTSPPTIFYSVLLKGDTAFETDETFTVTLSNPLAGDLGDATATGTILNDDLPRLKVLFSQTSIAETAGNGALTVTITRQGATTNSLPVDLQAFGALRSPKKVTILAGSDRAEVSLDVVDDSIATGAQAATLAASASGFVNGQQSLQITDNDSPTLTLSLNRTVVSESAGFFAASLTISRNTPTLTALVVDLLHPTTSRMVTLPATISIPARQSSVVVPIETRNTISVDGPLSVLIKTKAIGFTGDSITLKITDDDGPRLLLSGNVFTVNEGQTLTLQARRNSSATTATVVALQSDQPGRLQVPATITIPAGGAAQSVSFVATATENTRASGAEAVRITATAGGFGSGTVDISVVDNDAALTVQLDPQNMVENAGANATQGTVIRNTPPSTALTVQLESSDTTEATVPASVTIAANAIFATFPIAAVDDGTNDETQNLTIRARATNFATGERSLQVLDNDLPGLRLRFRINPVREPLSATVELNAVQILRVERIEPNPANALTPLNVSLSSSSNADVQIPNSNLILPPGNGSGVDVPVLVLADTLTEGAENVTFTAQATGHQAGTTALTILDGSDPHDGLFLNVSASKTRFYEGDETNLSIASASVGSVPRAALKAYVISVSSADSTQPTPVFEGVLHLPTGDVPITLGPNVPTLVIPLYSPPDDLSFNIETITSYPARQPTVRLKINVAAVYYLVPTPADLDSAKVIEKSVILEILDDTDRALQIDVAPAPVAEGNTARVTVRRLKAALDDLLIVNLFSSNPLAFPLPPTITIPAGAEFFSFDVTVPNDNLQTGARRVLLNGASATASYLAATTQVEVLDDDGDSQPTLQIELVPPVTTESFNVTGQQIVAAIIRRVDRNPATANQPLTVNLSASNGNSDVLVPATTVIPPGNESRIIENLLVLSDTQTEGAEAITINATATGYTAARAALTILDRTAENEYGLSVRVASASVNEGGTMTLFLSYTPNPVNINIPIQDQFCLKVTGLPLEKIILTVPGFFPIPTPVPNLGTSANAYFSFGVPPTSPEVPVVIPIPQNIQRDGTRRVSVQVTGIYQAGIPNGIVLPIIPIESEEKTISFDVLDDD